MTTSTDSPDKQLSISSTPSQQPSVQKSNFEDWAVDDDEDYYYHDRPKRERGGRKKNKKNKPQERERTWDWDDIYDPTMPNSYTDYKGSDEQYREIRDWKARLYYQQLKEANKEKKENKPAISAPPTNLNFAPPTFDDGPAAPRVDDDDEDMYQPQLDSRDASEAPEPLEQRPAFAAAAAVRDDASGDDVYLRRMRMSQAAATPPVMEEPVVTHKPVLKQPDVDVEAKRAEAQAKIAAFKAKHAKPQPPAAPSSVPVVAPVALLETQANSPAPPPAPAPAQPAGTVSRAPVRYELPPPPPDMPDDDTIMEDAEGDQSDNKTTAEEPRSNKPGQKGFAERLLRKYGWEKGKGLGAQGEGITTALVGKADKRKKLADAEGGGWAQPKNMGKIVGGKRRKLDEEGDDPRLGSMSEVIKLEGMLAGLDVQKEIEEGDLMQEIGDEMGKKYGNVERLFIWREELGGANEVFVKFTSQLSALRAVNATDGMTFAGNEVVAGFWDREKFERGEYA